MEKILINLYVPAIQTGYDVFVPAEVSIRDLMPLLLDGVTDLSGGKYRTSEREVLCLQNPDMLLSASLSLSDYKIRNGDRIILL